MPRAQRISFPDLDVAKLIMALLVVEIHVKPMWDLGSDGLNALMTAIDGVAVPFFFIASGFLCFRGVDPADFSDASSASARRVRATASKLLGLYLMWTAVFLPVTLLGFSIGGDPLPSALFRFVRGVLLVGENYFSWPLWYLLASAVAFALVYALLRAGMKPGAILAVAAAVTLAGAAMQRAYGADAVPVALQPLVDFYFHWFVTVRNGLFEGFFYVALGLWLGARWERAASVRLAVPVCAATAGLAGCVLVTPDAHLPFCAAYATGVFLLSIRRHGADAPAHPLARNVSTGVYLTHMLFVVLFVYGIRGFSELSFSGSSGFSHMAAYAFALACSAAVSVAASLLSRRSGAVKRLFGF